MIPVFDGHNDLLFRLWQKNSAAAVSNFVDGEKEGQLDLPRMHDGGFVGGFFAMFVPSESRWRTSQNAKPAALSRRFPTNAPRK